MKQESKLVTVIVPTLRRPDLIEKCLTSLARQTLAVDDYEVMVMENDAPPDSIPENPSFRNVRYIALKENYATTASINLGLADSASKYVLLLNNDVELQPQFLATLVAVMEADANCAFTTGKLFRATERSRLDGAGDAMLLGGGAYRLGHCDLDNGQFDKQRWVMAGCGAAALFRRSVLKEIHGLDEDFFAYLDDVDLAIRSQWMGYKGYYVPEAIAYHIGSATLGGPMHPKVVELVTRNQIYLVAKHYPRSLLWKLLPRIVVFQILWFASVLRHLHLRAYLRGLLGAAKSIDLLLRKRAQWLPQRRIADEEFLQLLSASEKQVFDWHTAQSPDSRSPLLKAYFRLFRAPHSSGPSS